MLLRGSLSFCGSVGSRDPEHRIMSDWLPAQLEALERGMSKHANGHGFQWKKIAEEDPLRGEKNPKACKRKAENSGLIDKVKRSLEGGGQGGCAAQSPAQAPTTLPDGNCMNLSDTRLPREISGTLLSISGWLRLRAQPLPHEIDKWTEMMSRESTSKRAQACLATAESSRDVDFGLKFTSSFDTAPDDDMARSLAAAASEFDKLTEHPRLQREQSSRECS